MVRVADDIYHYLSSVVISVRLPENGMCVHISDEDGVCFLFFSSIILSTSLVPQSIVFQMDCLNTVSCMLYGDSVIPLMDQGFTVLCILLVYACWMLHTLTLR